MWILVKFNSIRGSVSKVSKSFACRACPAQSATKDQCGYW